MVTSKGKLQWNTPPNQMRIVWTKIFWPEKINKGISEASEQIYALNKHMQFLKSCFGRIGDLYMIYLEFCVSHFLKKTPAIWYML